MCVLCCKIQKASRAILSTHYFTSFSPHTESFLLIMAWCASSFFKEAPLCLWAHLCVSSMVCIQRLKLSKTVVSSPFKNVPSLSLWRNSSYHVLLANYFILHWKSKKTKKEQGHTLVWCWFAELYWASLHPSPPDSSHWGPLSVGRRWSPGHWPVRCPAGEASSQQGRVTAKPAKRRYNWI